MIPQAILFLLSLTLIIAGIVIRVTTSSWSLLSVISIILGILIAVVVLVLWLRKQKAFWQRRSTSASINALLITAAIFVIIGLINFIVIRHNWRFDLTENKIFTLAPQSQQIIAQLEQPLKVWVFDRNVDPEIKLLLENYRRYGDKFQFQFVDPEIEIGLAEQFKVESLGTIYVQYENKTELIKTTNDPENVGLSETQLTNAIAGIQRDRTSEIYFLQGHGEPEITVVQGGFSQAIEELQNRGYLVKSLNLTTTDKIPENARLIAIANPTRKLFPGEITLLKQYLDNGGNALLMLMPNTNTGLGTITEEWGVELDNRFVIDSSDTENILGFGPGVSIINTYGDHPITQNFQNGFAVFPESQALKIVAQENIDAIPFVITSQNTWAESNLARENLVFNAQEDLPGPLNIAIALTRKATQSKPSSRMVIFGGGTFATNGWFQQQLNGDIFLNSVDWTTGEEQPVLSIRPQEHTNRRINLSPLQAGFLSWMAIKIMPLLSFIVAGVIWWRKR